MDFPLELRSYSTILTFPRFLESGNARFQRAKVPRFYIPRSPTPRSWCLK